MIFLVDRNDVIIFQNHRFSLSNLLKVGFLDEGTPVAMVSDIDLVTILLYGKVLSGNGVKNTRFWRVINVHKVFIVHPSKGKGIVDKLYSFVVKMLSFQYSLWSLVICSSGISIGGMKIRNSKSIA